MSFESQLQNIVYAYIEKVAKQYNLERESLYSLWSNSTIAVEIVKDVTPADITKASKIELVAMCKAKGLKVTGKKEDLVSRLLGTKSNTSTPKTPNRPIKKDKQTLLCAPKKDKQTLLKTAPILKQIADSGFNIIICKNTFGNLEHSSSGLVFDEESKMVIGKQNQDGSIDMLTDEDIEQCKKYKFKYEVPINLDEKDVDNVKITELDDILENPKVEEPPVEEEEEEEIVIEDSEEEQ